MHHSHAEMYHLTKSRNRKLIRETLLNERMEHNCVDLSDYIILYNSELDRAFAQNLVGRCIHGHAEMTHDQISKPELFSRDVTIMMNKDVYIK